MFAYTIIGEVMVMEYFIIWKNLILKIRSVNVLLAFFVSALPFNMNKFFYFESKEIYLTRELGLFRFTVDTSKFHFIRTNRYKKSVCKNIHIQYIKNLPESKIDYNRLIFTKTVIYST